VGGQYPNELLTLVIWNNTRSEFKQPPEDIYDHKMVWITGKVILYKDRPEIVISNPDQIQQIVEAPAQKQ
jgi:micrococcal nuclease